MMSAPVSRGPFLRPHPPSHPPSGRAAANIGNSRGQNSGGLGNPMVTQDLVGGASSKASDSVYGASGTSSHDVMSKGRDQGHSNGVKLNPQASRMSMEAQRPKDAIYDANGIRLDRTPTDDEINWLWDKVRTCLSRNSTRASSSSIDASKPDPHISYEKTPVAVSQKFIDGSSLAPQFGVATRLSGVNDPNAGQSGKAKRVTMDSLNSYTKKANLLNQRKAGGGNGGVIAYHQPTSKTQATIYSLQERQPQPSVAEPQGRKGEIPSYTDNPGWIIFNYQILVL